MPERKPINEYDALLQQKSADKALRQTLTGATMHDPDAFAESQRLAAESGVPAPIIARNPDPVKQRTQVNEYEAALKKYPQLREFIANNPSAAVVAQDDLDNMGAIEIAIDRTKSYGRALAAGPAALATGFAGIEEFMARGIEADFERFARWGIIPENPFRGLGEKAAAGRRFGQELTETIAGPDPVGAGSTELGIRSGLQSAGMNLPPLLASYVSGNPSLALGLMSSSAGGLKFGEAIDQGASTGLAFQAAVNEGVIEAITERLPAFKLFGDLKKGTPFYKTILAQMAIEIPSEQAATVLQDFSDWMLLHPEKTTQEFLNERSGAAYQTLIATVVGTGVQTGAIAGIDRLQRRGTDDMTRASSALEAQDALRKLTEAAANSKTLSRDRNTVEAAAQSMAGEDAEDLYIDASIARDVLNQEGINIEDILDDAPSLREQFEEAVALGGEVRIPVAEFVARVADKSYAEFLIPHVRIGADNMTAAEAQEFTEEQAERFRQEAEELLGEDADTQQIQAEIDELADTIAAQVEATGRFPNDIAQSYGSLAASFFATTAARAGMSPAQMAERFALQVQGESVEGALDQVQAPQAYLAENAPEVAPEGFTRFRHFGQLPVPTLDPAFMGTGIRGAERARGANRQPVLSLYPDQGFVKEVGLGNVEFVVDLPSDRVYDLGEDPLNLTEQAQDVTGFRIENGEQVPVSTRTDFNQLEQLIQEAGFLGYVTPDGEGNLAGQARLFDRVEVEGVDTSEAEALLDNPLFQLKPEFEPVGFKNVARHLNPDELQNLRRDTAQKLVNLFGELPRDIDFADTALAGEAKRGWYNRATLALREIFGETDAPRFAALVAALSPQTSVQINLENAALAWVAWNEAGRPEGADEINQVLNQSVGKGNPNSVLNAWRNNAVRALSTPDAMEIMLSGPKVNSFMHNLLGNMQEVTNDAWMAAFALMEQTIFSGSMTKSGPGKRPGYLAFTAKIRRAADKLGWTPAEVQETIWSWVKTAYELSDAAGETRSVEELLQAGEITDERIANTPSFADLFVGQASIREILEAAGYGEQIQAIEEELTDDRDPGEGAGTTRVTPGLLRTARRLDALKRQRAEAERLNREAATPIDGDALPPIFLVLSGEDATLTPEENLERINQLEQDLEEMGLDPQRADGMYKGTAEASFLVPAENDKQIAAVYNLAFEKYGQESVLHVDQDRNARLEFEEDFPVALGKFIETRDTTGLEAFTSIGGRSFTTVAEEAAPLFQQLPTVLGMYSGVAKAAQDMKLPEWKQDDTKPISGRAIWQKLIKMPGVKKEEIELLGLEEYLTAKKKDKFSRQAVLDYINNNGAHVEEVVATEADTNETGGVPFDDPVALSVEETRSFLLTRAMADYDIGHTAAGGFNVQDLTLKWAEENIDVVLDEFLPANLVAPSARAKFEAMSPKEALDTIIADNGEGTVTTALRANTKLRAHFE